MALPEIIAIIETSVIATTVVVAIIGFLYQKRKETVGHLLRFLLEQDTSKQIDNGLRRLNQISNGELQINDLWLPDEDIHRISRDEVMALLLHYESVCMGVAFSAFSRDVVKKWMGKSIVLHWIAARRVVQAFRFSPHYDYAKDSVYWTYDETFCSCFESTARTLDKSIEKLTRDTFTADQLGLTSLLRPRPTPA